MGAACFLDGRTSASINEQNKLLMEDKSAQPLKTQDASFV
jgi:hypothetical protein